MSACISKKKEKKKRLKQEASCTSLSVWEGNVLLFWRQSPTLPNVLTPQRHCFVIQFRTIKLRDPHDSSMSTQRQHQKQEFGLLVFLRLSRLCLVFMWWLISPWRIQPHSQCLWVRLDAKESVRRVLESHIHWGQLEKETKNTNVTHMYTQVDRQTDRHAHKHARTHTKKHTDWWR